MLEHDDDMGDAWRGYRLAQQERRAERLPIRTQEILALRVEGYLVKQLSAYQFRINHTIDVYPIHNRWHHIKTGQRGGARDLAAFIRKRFPPYYAPSPASG